jgi:hypothetical protein
MMPFLRNKERASLKRHRINALEKAPHLGKLEADGPLPVLRNQPGACVLDDLQNGVLRTVRRLPVRDGDHEHWFGQLAGGGPVEHQRLEHVLVHAGAKRGEALELGLGHAVVGLLSGPGGVLVGIRIGA